MSSDWTKVTPDSRISLEGGESFFARVKEIAELAANDAFKANKNDFKLIDECCYFVYLVRNNIFHGQKQLGDIYEADQARRIAVYDLFIRCVNSMFFLAVGRSDYGSAMAQLPIIQSIGDVEWKLPIEKVLRLIGQPFGLKSEDSFLHWKLFRSTSTRAISPDTKSALFYPSAGKDIQFPLIIGLPYCTDFYFYEITRLPQPRMVEPKFSFMGLSATSVEMDSPDRLCYEIEIDSVPRRIWFMRMNNETFLDVDIPLGFYFHRGDSWGNGGSGQKWDSEHLPALVDKANSKAGLRILTDAEPGGLRESTERALRRISPPNSSRGRDYYYGVLKK